MKNLLFFALTITTISCGENRKSSSVIGNTGLEKDSDFLIFDFERGIFGIPKYTSLNELIDSISYIPLETNKDVLLPENHAFAKIGSDLFIGGGRFIRSSPIYQFDSLGRFVKQVTFNGRGPNEIVATWMWHTNESLKQINVVDMASKMVLIDVGNGETSTININTSHGLDMAPLNDGIFVSSQPLNYTDIPETYLYFTNQTGKLVHTVDRNDDLLSYNTKTLENIQAPPYEIYRLWPNYKGDVIFHDIFNDTLYRIKSYRDITPHLVFKRGALSPDPKDKLNSDKKQKQIHIGYVLESGDYLFVNYFYGGEIWRDIWSKRDKSMLMHTVSKKQWATISDVLFPFMLPDGSFTEIQVEYASKDIIYCTMEAVVASKFLLDIKGDDNPVIVIAKLKR